MTYTKLHPTIAESRVSSTPSSSSSPAGAKSKYLKWQTASLAFGMAWIIPALVVLQLNFTSHIVGPSIGCLRSSCRIDQQLTTQIRRAQDLATQDRNALGGLQIAAKALEAWFCVIAASLVYNVLKRVAGTESSRSLPIGYLHVHTECADLISLRKLFWGRIHDAQEESRRMGTRGWWSRMRLYFFILFVACICILCNLMGAATAILVIPNLEWTDINQAQNVWFGKSMSDQRPLLAASIAPSCTDENLTAGAYSCTGVLYISTTDAIIADAKATDDQIWQRNVMDSARSRALVLPPILQEGNISFTYNISDSIVWVPTRQTLRNMSLDLLDFDTMTTTDRPPLANYPKSGLFNHSLQSRLQQHGPIMGLRNACFLSNITNVISVESGRNVRCYQGQNITKCFPFGPRWANVNQAFSSFIIEDTSNQTTGLNVSIYSTSISLEMWNSTFDCVMRGNCTWDWNEAFSGPQKLPNRTLSDGPQQTFEYSDNISKDGSFIWCDSQSVLGFADYELDPDPLSNKIRLAESNVIDDSSSHSSSSSSSLFMHPDWTLAAWSVDQNGTVDGSRGGASEFLTIFENWLYSGSASQSAKDFQLMHLFMALQTISLVPYTTTTQEPTNTTSNPALPRKAMIEVWKYDLNSPSSIFGVVIVILGCVCVMARTFLYKEDTKDATEILETAMKRNSTQLLRQEEWDVEKNEDEFPVLKIIDDEEGTRKIRFHG